jgi:hypothetical protein
MSQVANLSDTTANTEATSFAPLCNNGTINIYSGAQPLNANTALGSNTLLATLTFGSPAFGAPASGVLTANAITGADALASGTATFARCFESDGTTVIMDIQVGTSAAFALVLSSTAIVDGNPVSISSLTYTVTEMPSGALAGQIPNLSDTAANTQASALAPLCNSGTINFYTGTQPANANTALSGNNLLATLGFGSTAFGAPSGGTLTANPITSGIIIMSGMTTFARLLQSDGMTVVMDLQVGVSGAGINLNTTNLVDGAPLAMTGFAFSVTET